MTPRVGHAGSGLESDVVDDVAAIARQFDVADTLGRRRSRFGELPGHAADLYDRQSCTEGRNDGHLQEDAQRIADRVRGMFREALGTIAALQQKGFAGGDLCEHALQLARLARENERRKAGKLRLDLGERPGVRIDRRLLDRLQPPAVGGPSLLCHRVRSSGPKEMPRPNARFIAILTRLTTPAPGPVRRSRCHRRR